MMENAFRQFVHKLSQKEWNRIVPFPKKPEGLDDVSLELLDNAMTKLWLEQVALGAAQKGAPTILQTAILDQLRVLKEPHKRHTVKKVPK